jgi:hypothetical protein
LDLLFENGSRASRCDALMFIKTGFPQRF